MSTLADQYAYSQTVGFQNQVKEAVINAAVAISGEAQAFDTQRRRLAEAILAPNGLSNYLPVFALAVANDATFSTTIAAGGASSTGTDAQIEAAVAAAWNAIANQ